ncbi:MAG TPA: HAD family hydrolase [Bacillales bacterium]|nr:HAD family hydrolase [Bacillales bacterium]
MLKTVIFDFDGTLADTLPIIFKAFQHIFKTYRSENVSPEAIIRMFGLTEEGIIRENFTPDLAETVITDFHHFYQDHHDTWVKRSQEIEDLLHFIKAKGLNLAIMTGKGRATLDLSLKALEMEDLFDMTVTGDEVSKPKPDPEGILKIMRALNTSPDEAIFIGDSNNDICAGKSAGVETIGVQWLENYQSSHFTADPDHVFTRVEDFRRYLEQSV